MKSLEIPTKNQEEQTLNRETWGFIRPVTNVEITEASPLYNGHILAINIPEFIKDGTFRDKVKNFIADDVGMIPDEDLEQAKVIYGVKERKVKQIMYRTQSQVH
jgi:hypothetical protein